MTSEITCIYRGRGSLNVYCRHSDMPTTVKGEACNEDCAHYSQGPVELELKPDHRNGKTSNLKGGPGAEFAGLISQLGLQSVASCSCASLQREMDRLGVDGCRRERSRLIKSLKENYVKYTAADKMWASYNAVITGLAFKLNPLDPIPSLFDEAVRRAEEKATADS